jgi:hypothetical protein
MMRLRGQHRRPLASADPLPELVLPQVLQFAVLLLHLAVLLLHLAVLMQRVLHLAAAAELPVGGEHQHLHQGPWRARSRQTQVDMVRQGNKPFHAFVRLKQVIAVA